MFMRDYRDLAAKRRGARASQPKFQAVTRTRDNRPHRQVSGSCLEKAE
jgi:hypothetical protein